ncbi:hypothetical protein ACLOEZ_10340 [Levilactobacillus brevis]|uniref:hypothetical protein n=1 Tax=Levilactobacillus brevis TaxID=1580 RepID=UPI003EC024B8
MNPEYFAQEVKLAALQARSRHFYDDIRAQIVAATAIGKTEFSVKTDEPFPRDVLTALANQGIENIDDSLEHKVYETVFDITEMLVNR